MEPAWAQVWVDKFETRGVGHETVQPESGGMNEKNRAQGSSADAKKWVWS